MAERAATAQPAKCGVALRARAVMSTRSHKHRRRRSCCDERCKGLHVTGGGGCSRRRCNLVPSSSPRWRQPCCGRHALQPLLSVASTRCHHLLDGCGLGAAARRRVALGAAAQVGRLCLLSSLGGCCRAGAAAARACAGRRDRAVGLLAVEFGGERGALALACRGRGVAGAGGGGGSSSSRQAASSTKTASLLQRAMFVVCKRV